MKFGDPYVGNSGIQCMSRIMCNHAFKYHVNHISKPLRVYKSICTFFSPKEIRTFRTDTQIILKFRPKHRNSLHFSATVRMFASSAWYRRGLFFQAPNRRNWNITISERAVFFPGGCGLDLVHRPIHRFFCGHARLATGSTREQTGT